MKEIPAFTREYVSKTKEELIDTLWLMLEEDDAKHDVSAALVPDKEVAAKLVVKEECVISGVSELSVLFELAGASFDALKSDGDCCGPGEVVFKLSGNAAAILKVERTALNIFSRMCGITSLTRKHVEVLESVGSNAKVAATRKTTPLFRYFEKKAVVVGGGVPHRMSLSDMVLIKDNHLEAIGGVRQALEAAKSKKLDVPIEVEVETLEDALKAAKAGADVIMLDNMDPTQINETVSALKDGSLRDDVCIEVSGGINLETIADYGGCGVDVISVGGLTMNAKAVDVGLEFISDE